MKFIVAQIGARRGYAVPAILERAGMLERFYTDMAGNTGFGALLSALPMVNGRVKRLAGRKLPESIRAKTVSFTLPDIARALRRKKKCGDAAETFRNALRFSESLGDAMAHRGFGQATHLYSMLGECAPLLRAARERGIKVVSEIYILLATENILAKERKDFPGWEPDTADHSAVRREFGVEDLLLTHSDFAICPSEMVQEDLVTRLKFPRDRTALVPYGMNPELLSVSQSPVRGRVLFVGTAELRKGIHYFAMAAEKLLERGLRYEFRVAGNVTSRVAQQPVCQHLNFLGRVPRAEMAGEFAAADVFVLPSLAEGSAEVVYEALACGVPVVTTNAAGSVVRDGVEGRIVPERDPAALAEAMAEIVEDRDKRNRMAVAARERARDYTWDRYGERLISVLRNL